MWLNGSERFVRQLQTGFRGAALALVASALVAGCSSNGSNGTGGVGGGAGSGGGGGLAVTADLASDSDIQRIVDETLARFGRIDLLVNNAAIIHPRIDLVDFDADLWRKVLDVNLTGAALLIFELYTAGIGIAGVVGAISFILGCYGFDVLPVRWWALALLVVAMLGYAIDVQTGVPRAWSAIATVCLVVGSLFLYDGPALSWITLLAGRLPPQRALIGVQPESIDWSDKLSPAVAAVLPGLCETVRGTLTRWRVRPVGRSADAWRGQAPPPSNDVL